MSATVCTQVTKSQASAPKPGLIGRFREWRRALQEREALARMEQRDLDDLNLSRWDIEREIARHLGDF